MAQYPRVGSVYITYAEHWSDAEDENFLATAYSNISLLRRGFNTAKPKAREASARFLTQYGVQPGGDTNYIWRIRYGKRHMIQYIYFDNLVQ